MDIRSKAVNSTAVMHVRDADDTPLFNEDGEALQIVLFGPGSKQYRTAAAAQSNRLIARMKKSSKVELTDEQKAQENAEHLASITDSFVNIEYDDKSGRDLFIAVYSDPSLGFIADQVARFSADWANFSKPSAKN